MSSTRGFENLPIIKRSIHELYRALGPKGIKSFMQNFEAPALAYEVRRDPLIGTQRMARRIAEHYGLPITTVVVRYNGSMAHAGLVELSHTNEFFVELHLQHKNVPAAVAAILAHEVAHIFLHRAGIRFPDTFENEVLTDTTAAYLGFGLTLLEAATETTRHEGDVIHTQRHHFGYITVDEFGYIQARRDHAFGMDSSTAILHSFPLSALENGRRRFEAERRGRPYRRSFLEGANHLFRRLLRRPPPPPKSNEEKLCFACLYCSQELRIPLLGKELLVKCPVCEAKLTCFS